MFWQKPFIFSLSIIIVLIICPIAGVGSRLHPITITKPKAMIKIAGKRLMDYLMEKLMECFPQQTEICFIVGYKKKQIIDYLNKNYSHYFKLIYVEQQPIGYKKEIPYFSGLGDAVSLAAPYGRNQDIFIFLSDRLPLESYKPMLDKMREKQLDGVINVRKVQEPQHYGIICLDSDGYITKMVEKPKDPPSNLAVSGAYLFSKSISGKLFELLELQAKQELKPGKEHDITGVIYDLIKTYKAKMGVNEMNLDILDVGRTDSLLDANQQLLSLINKSNTVINAQTEQNLLENSKLIPPVFIGKNSSLKKCVIGPNVSIGDNCNLTRCIIENSVLGDHCTLENIITEGSVIGDFVTIEDVVKNSMVIGDSSSLSKTKNGD